jgi:hypothetical protein
MCFHVCWHLAVEVFPIGITWESRLKAHAQDLPRGGGHQPLSSPMERQLPLLTLTHEWLPRFHLDPDSVLQCQVLDH